jgi:tol-pal system protein YbgF
MPVNRFRFAVMASCVLAIAFSVPANAQVDSEREQMIDLVLQVQQLQDEVRMLRGLIEEQAIQIDTIQRRQRDQYLDLDQRINELGNVTPIIAGAAAEPAREPATRIIPPEEDTPEIREERSVPSTVTSLAAPQTVEVATASTPEMEKAAYDGAFQSLKELRYSDAAEQFSDFLTTFPGSEFADNAQYWLGESYYVTRNFDFALEAFEALLSQFPESPKVPDSLLKIGYTHYELKQWELARAALTQVQEQYPNSTLARLAESRLRSMRLEGHY